MAQSLPAVKLPSNKWVDLYDDTGITVGVKLVIQNTGTSQVILVEDSSQPPTNPPGSNVVKADQYVTNKTGNIGAWAFSSDGSTLQVEES